MRALTLCPLRPRTLGLGRVSEGRDNPRKRIVGMWISGPGGLGGSRLPDDAQEPQGLSAPLLELEVEGMREERRPATCVHRIPRSPLLRSEPDSSLGVWSRTDPSKHNACTTGSASNRPFDRRLEGKVDALSRPKAEKAHRWRHWRSFRAQQHRSVRIPWSTGVTGRQGRAGTGSSSTPRGFGIPVFTAGPLVLCRDGMGDGTGVGAGKMWFP